MSSEPIEEVKEAKRECKGGISPVGMVVIAVALVLMGSLARDYNREATMPALSALAASQPTLAKMPAADQLYQQNCAICHGIKGEGNGPASFVMEILPRNFAGVNLLDFDSGKYKFHPAKYRFVTSSNGVPYKEDVIRTIRHGLAGTSMVSWQDLTDQQVDGLADYVLEISKLNYRAAMIEGKVEDAFKPEGAVNPGPEPKTFTDADLTAARTLFASSCAVCHGADGKGMTNPEWKTEEGLPIASRNFRSGVFKAGGRGKDLYARIYSGIPGTPMPPFNVLQDKDIWLLVHYIQRMSSPEGQESDVFKVRIADDSASPEKAVAANRHHRSGG